MKRFLAFLLVTILLIFSKNASAQDLDNPLQYMQVISKQQENVSKKIHGLYQRICAWKA